jgi:uncharacterized membrane protein YkoI
MMRTIRIAAAVVAMSSMAASLVAAQAPKAGKSVDLSKYPAPVRATIENETKNATLKGVSKETEKGKTQYEVETLVNGKSRDLLVDPAGKVIEVEEEIALTAAPQPVQTALGKHGTIVKVEKVTHDGGAATYEARVKAKSGKTSSVALDADGKPVKG